MKNITVSFVLLFLIGCNADTTNNQHDFDQDSSLIFRQVIEILPDQVEMVIESIPPPLEMTSLIQGLGANYSKNILNPTENIKNYNTNFKKAINLGIYGADLGYINLYEQNQDALLYLNCVKELADDLRVGHYLDFKTLKQLTTMGGNLDSLLYITTSNFEDMYHSLREQNRSSITISILTGSWLEALHIAAQIDKLNIDEQGHKQLSERIGEQKVTLAQIMIVLGVYKNDHNIQKLRNNLENLKKLYKQVEIEYTYEAPTFKEIDGMLIVEDHSSSTIIITQELLSEIAVEVESIRRNLTN
ncbi:MAG: hypothetical protein FVQ77_09445 [Cytophagales bacterium]|nr:hypothetical protein [Cytophagales bacterium]